MPRPAAIATTNTDMLPSISHTFKVEQWLMNEVQDGDSPSVDLPSTNENASKSRSRMVYSLSIRYSTTELTDIFH